jgi:hypothetical protein
MVSALGFLIINKQFKAKANQKFEIFQRVGIFILISEAAALYIGKIISFIFYLLL